MILLRRKIFEWETFTLTHQMIPPLLVQVKYISVIGLLTNCISQQALLEKALFKLGEMIASRYVSAFKDTQFEVGDT